MCDVQGLQEQLGGLTVEAAAAGGGGGGGAGAVYEPAKPHLCSMPVEIILKICSFLEADFLKRTVAKVCKRLETILADGHLWKYWYHSKLKGGVYPALPNLKHWEEEPIDWQALCAESASEKRKWENVQETMRHIVVKDVHFASVDTVLLVNNGEFCISGGRDRGMALWRVPELGWGAGQAGAGAGLERPRHIRHGAHGGWVWDLAPDCERNTRQVYSASWDNTVKAWDLQTEFTCVETFRCGMSALAVTMCDDAVMAGLYSKRVLSFDVRAGPRPVAAYKPHRGPVLALAARRGKVASISEDRTLCVWDRAAGRALVSGLRLPTEKAYPVCVSWGGAALYVGDSKGALHLLHPERLAVVASHEVWPEPPLTQPACKPHRSPSPAPRRSRRSPPPVERGRQGRGRGQGQEQGQEQEQGQVQAQVQGQEQERGPSPGRDESPPMPETSPPFRRRYRPISLPRARSDDLVTNKVITGCLQADYGLVLCSDRGEIKFLYNSLPPREYVSLRSTTHDVTQMRYLNGVLAIGTCDSALELWVPRALDDAWPAPPPAEREPEREPEPEPEPE